MIRVGEKRDAEKHHDRQRRHRDERRGRVLRFGRTEGRDAVGNGLHPGHRRTPVGERGQKQQPGERLRPRFMFGCKFRGHDRSDQVPVKTDRDQQQDRNDKEVCRHRENPARLANAAQVADREQRQKQQAQLDPVRRETRHRRGDGKHAGRNADRHGEGVVDEQRRRGHESGGDADIFLGDAIGAAAGRIRVNGLPIGKRDHRQQGGDDDADRDRIAERLRSGDDQGSDDEIGRVGDRRQRIRREHGETGDTRQPLVVREVRRNGLAEEEPFQRRERRGFRHARGGPSRKPACYHSSPYAGRAPLSHPWPRPGRRLQVLHRIGRGARGAARVGHEPAGWPCRGAR